MLRTERLSAGYGMFQALFDVSFHVAPGEVVALIGANGAGKSTLLRAIVGSVPAARDSVTLDGTPVGGCSEIERLHMGIALVPEGRRLFPSLTVEENLLLAAGNGRPGPWTVARLFRELPALDGLRRRPATALSGGQQQLVALCRALASNPHYVLCDEVSLGLSPVAVDAVYGLLAKVRNEGVAMVLVEQNVRRALGASHRYYCLQKGRIVLEGASREADYGRVATAYFGV
ncbi:MAG: ABC transporter ATP-binding protein [Xanthobacteraceae bacterium]|nr:ABC transporter ATP-binding protein [Xanthobacteraceae bacterium]